MTASEQAAQLYTKASKEWGGFRRYLALHPLTVFWITLGGALAVGWLVGRLTG